MPIANMPQWQENWYSKLVSSFGGKGAAKNELKQGLERNEIRIFGSHRSFSLAKVKVHD